MFNKKLVTGLEEAGIVKKEQSYLVMLKSMIVGTFIGAFFIFSY